MNYAFANFKSSMKSHYHMFTRRWDTSDVICIATMLSPLKVFCLRVSYICYFMIPYFLKLDFI